MQIERYVHGNNSNPERGELSKTNNSLHPETPDLIILFSHFKTGNINRMLKCLLPASKLRRIYLLL